MKTILLAVAVLIGSSAWAQTKPLKVLVEGEDGAHQVVNAVFTRQLSLDTHFQLVSDSHFDVLVHLTCIEPLSGKYACSYAIIYEPDDALGAQDLIGDGVVTASGTEEVGKLLFAPLIQATTPDSIAKAQKYLDSVIGTIMRLTREAEVQQKAGA